MDEALDWEERAIQAMRDEVTRLLADAIRAAHETRDETDRVADETQDETDRVAEETHDETDRVANATRVETSRVQDTHDDEMREMAKALASRDIFGMAKGIIMVTMNCEPDDAFELIRKQSQAENRKASEVATEIVARVIRRSRQPPTGF
jgi:hypothetical protein